MRAASIFYINQVRYYRVKSVYKVYRKTEKGWTVLNNVNKDELERAATIPNQQQHDEIDVKHKPADGISNNRSDCRENEMKIQMLSKSLYDQIFKNNNKTTPDQLTIKK